MSWADDYFKLLEEEKKKKKKNEEKKTTPTFETSPYSAMGRLAIASSPQSAFQQATKGASQKWKEEQEKKEEEEAKKRLDVLTQTSTLNDPAGEFGAFLGQKIGDALTREKDGEKWYEGWFQKGNEKDVAKTILGTGADAATDFTTGIVGMGEKFVDWLAGIAPYVAQAAYYSNGGGYNLQADRMFNDSIALSKSELEKFAEKDLYDEEEVAKEIVSRLNSAAYLYQINQSGSFATPEQFAYSQQIHQETKKYMDTDMEDDSVLAHKSDALVQSSGQLAATAALSAAGVPWWVTTGTTAWGGELENALKEGATLEEANLSGAISAGAEVLTEKISGGISFGGKTLDDAVTTEIARGISNKVARNLAKIGVDMAGEGAEEVLSGFMSNLGSALYKEENLGEILFSEEAIDEYIESFISGAALGGGSSVNTAITSAVNGVDAVTGLTKNEQSVVDKVYKDAIQEAEKDGKLTNKEKAEIYDRVLEDMKNGYIGTDVIEEVLGDRSSYDALETEAKEFDKLYNTASMELSKAQQDRLAELEAKNKANPYQELLKAEKDKYSQSVFDMVKGDRLSESYAERSRRGQAFEADLSKYDKKQQETIRKAIDSGILNNTNRTHAFVDMVAKISADKGVLFDFTNNEKLKNSGFVVDGKQVNGFVTKDGITVNVNSSKSLNKVVGHEIAHVLEGTELYGQLQEAITEYAKSKGEYQSRYDALTKLYENIEGANIDNELTAELVGEYLFSDQDFVNNLSVQNQNVFQKIWDEVKYLAKVATAGSKEARELAKVQRAFEKAYREAGKATSETKYSIGEIVDESNKSYGIGVHLDSTLLDNLTPDERKAMVKERIKELGGEVFTAYDNNGNAVDITIAKHNAHFKNANGKKRLVNNDLTTKYIGDEVKQEAVVLIDELITTSKFQGADPAKHAHGWLDNNGQNDWDVWTTYIQDKNNTIWEATLHIANTANGEKIIYDVVPTKKVGQSGNSDTSLLANNVAQNGENVKYSLSEEGQAYKPGRGWNVRGEDIALENAARPAENVANVSEDIAPVAEDLFPDTNEPGVDELMAEAQDIMGAMEAYEAVGDTARAERLAAEYEDIMEKIGQMERDQRQRADSLTDADVPPEMDAPYYGDNQNADPFADRAWDDVVGGKNRNVKAYMYEHPEVKPYFQAEAAVLFDELQATQKGERWYNDEVYYESGGEQGYGGTKRRTSDSIARMLDEWNMSYADIEKGLKAIMEDNGAENISAAKKVEFMLNERLRDGYKSFTGYEPNMDQYGRVMPNQEYIDTVQEASANAYSQEAFDALMAEYAPVAEKTAAPAKYEAIRQKPTKEPAMAKATPAEQAQSAKILFGEQQSPKQKNAWKWAKEHIFRHGAVFEDLSLKTGNRELQAKFDMIRRAESRAQTFIGKGGGNAKALVDVKNMVEKAGKTEAFNYYLYHLHNVDRMTLEQRFADVPNKAVFGDAVTAEVSQKAATNLETLNPEFKQWAEDVYAINKHLRQMMVDEGMISQETADLWQKMYPHYVPINRADAKGMNVNVPLDTKRTGVNAPIKKATGGNSDFYNVFDTMGARIEQTYKAIAKNRFGVELKNTLGTEFDSEAVDIDSVMESVDNHEQLLQEGKNGESPSFTVFENGERVTYAITEDMYEAMKPSQFTYTNEALKKVNDVRRDILTTYNPTFALTNPIKDVQDIFLNSQHPVRTYATIPEAIKSVLTKDQWYQERMENGGNQDSYFDGQTKTFQKEDGVFKKVMGFPFEKIQAVNEVIEQVPRMAEYIASRKMGRSVDVSMLDAARVTTNFGAPGDFTNMLNRNGFTFLGASVEGFNQQYRNLREAKAEGVKGVLKLAAKTVAVGLPAMLLNHLLWDDDEDYEELSDYVKQNFYVVAKTEEGKFIRIPKGRAVAVIQDAFQQMANLVTGNDEADWAALGQLLINNLAPNNPLENNIIAPIGQAITNKAWYGGDLVPTRLQDLPAAEQFDETTDSFSKWLGDVFDISPYKVNYLLDQYSGGVGDIVLPYLTPEADGGGLGAAFRDKFVTDPVLKNQNVTDFYDKKDELAVNANSMYATEEDKLMAKYMSSVNAQLSQLYTEKREIQNSDMSDAEKYAAVRDIQAEIVELTRMALDRYDDIRYSSARDGEYAHIGNKYFKRDEDGQWQSLSSEQAKKYRITSAAGDASYAYGEGEHYRWYEPDEDSDAEAGWRKITDSQLKKQAEVTKGLGITPEEYWSNKEEYDYAYEHPGNYAMSKAVGGYTSYRTYSSELYDIKADKDKYGKSITGSRKEKVIDYINDLDLDAGAKYILLKSEYPSDNTYNYEIIEYLDSRADISYEEMKAILEELGFYVNGNRISWD